MFRTNSLLTGLAAGAGLTYFFDAAQGARRRKLLADQFNHLASACLHDFDVSWRDLKNRSQGTAAVAQRVFASGDATDETVVQRARAVLGHHASHAHAIEVQSEGGHVVLRGPISRSELFGLLQAIGSVPGVRTVTDELTVQDHEGNGAMQIAARDWSPGTKLVVGTVGGALLLNCLTARRRSLRDVVLGTLGFGLLARSLGCWNQGSGSTWSTVQFHKTILIHAPIEKVFNFIATPGNWAAITNRIHGLRWHSENAFAKNIALPGMDLYCSERIARREQNKCFECESLPDSMLTYTKSLHFERAGDDTRVHLQFTYQPPGGAIGHVVGAVLGLDAKSFFDDFLMRARYFLETGEQPHDVARHHHARQESHDAGTNAPPHEAAPNQREDAVTAPLGM
jgi:uncharacterized membrane protein